MRKVTFIINDYEYFKKQMLEQAETEEQVNDILRIIFKDNHIFNAVYSLIGNNTPNRYELTTAEGEKLNINDLNGYEKGVVLNQCWDYFMGERNFDGCTMPCGVIEIKETEA